MDITKEEKEKNFFEEFGLEVTTGEIEVGKTYPIFGMITRLIDDTPGNISVEINHSLTARISLNDKKKIEILKHRAFESGIFVATVIAKEPNVQLDCKTVIFGRPQSHHA